MIYVYACIKHKSLSGFLLGTVFLVYIYSVYTYIQTWDKKGQFFILEK